MRTLIMLGLLMLSACGPVPTPESTSEEGKLAVVGHKTYDCSVITTDRNTVVCYIK